MHRGYFEAFSIWLHELYKLRTSGPRVLEAHVCNIMHEVLLPARGRAQVQFSIGDVSSMQ